MFVKTCRNDIWLNVLYTLFINFSLTETCTPLVVANAEVECNLSPVFVDHECTVMCNGGFIPDRQTVTCQTGNNWSAFQVCQGKNTIACGLKHVEIISYWMYFIPIRQLFFNRSMFSLGGGTRWSGVYFKPWYRRQSMRCVVQWRLYSWSTINYLSNRKQLVSVSNVPR